MLFFETSAKTSQQVTECFTEVTAVIIREQYKND